MNGPFHTREKLKNFWTNISLVSALLLGVTYSNAINPVSSDNPDMSSACSVACECVDQWKHFVNILSEPFEASLHPIRCPITAVMSGVSLVFSLSVIVVSVIYLIEIDNCTTERDLNDFIDSNAKIVDMLTGIFSGQPLDSPLDTVNFETCAP